MFCTRWSSKHLPQLKLSSWPIYIWKQRQHWRVQVQVDITVNNILAIVNTKLLRDYAAIDDRLLQLVFVVKLWAKRRQVNDSYRGTLSSYCYVLMCIHLLQQRSPPALPCLQAMQPTHSRYCSPAPPASLIICTWWMVSSQPPIHCSAQRRETPGTDSTCHSLNRR